VVIHFPATGRSVLPDLLNRCGRLSAAHAEDEDRIETGRIYVAPSDYHMLVAGEQVRLSHGPKENCVRPAIDPLFRSAAQSCGGRVIGVVLSGNRNDGTAGLLSIKEHGGIAVVQAPEDAIFAAMPRNAIVNVPVDHVVRVSEMGNLLVNLTRQPATRGENETSERGCIASASPIISAGFSGDRSDNRAAHEVTTLQ
jgi:two-component system chemotaxis response regulator CheB